MKLIKLLAKICFFSTESPNWHHVGKDKLLVCQICRVYFKKYGRMRPIENRIEPPSFIFKAAFESHDDDLSYSGRMRTRRSATPIFSSNGSARTKILQEIQEGKYYPLNRVDYWSFHWSLLICSGGDLSFEWVAKTSFNQPSQNKGRFCNNSEIDTFISKLLSVENKAKLS